MPIRVVPLVVVSVFLLGSPIRASAFEFHVFRSGMTAEELLEAAERADLPLGRSGLVSADRHFNPSLARPYQDTAEEFTYPASISGKPATVTLNVGGEGRRLYSLSLRWKGVGRGSEFAKEALAKLVDRHGPGTHVRGILRERVHWESAGDETVLITSFGGVELWYVDRILLPTGGAAQRVPPSIRGVSPTGAAGRIPWLPLIPYRSIAALLIALALLTGVLRLPAVRRRLGERRVRRVLARGRRRQGYQAVHDVTLPTRDGTTQIGHIVVSPGGVFVIETQSVRGTIEGQRWDEQWTEALGRRTRPFPNPLRQNEARVRALCERLGLREDQVHSVIVFTGGAKFGNEIPEHVLRPGDLRSYLESREARCFSDADVVKLANVLERALPAPGRATGRDPARSVKEKKARRAGQVVRVTDRAAAPAPSVAGDPPAPACPRCGREMSLRSVPAADGQARELWRCTGFPGCGGTILAA